MALNFMKMLRETSLLQGLQFRRDKNTNWENIDKNFVQVGNELQSQSNRIDNLIAGVEQPSEIVDSRVGADGTVYTVLKKRLDSEYNKLKSNLDRVVNVKDIGAKGNANYFNETDGKWYTDNSCTEEAQDDTEYIQTALNIGGTIVFPEGSYLAGSLVYKSTSILKGLGIVKIVHNINTGYTSPFPRAMITNENLPTYHDPSDTDREFIAGVASDIAIENIIFDGNGQHVYGVQAVAVDRLFVRSVKVQNTSGALDLRAIRDSVINAHADTISEDGISVTDQNFKPLATVTHRGITKNIIFENCIVENSCFANEPNTDVSDNAFEMDDGMQYVFFNNCVARNNKGSGFEIHLHTSEYDMEDIYFNNCIAENNVPVSTAYTRTVAGFQVGQTPLGSMFSEIYYNNCVSIGSPNALALSPGAQEGAKGDIYINGGKWVNSDYYYDLKTTDMSNSVFLLKKNFRNVVISKAVIQGNDNGFGIYTYTDGDGLTVSDCIFLNIYVPMRAGHYNGSVIFKDNIVNSVANTDSPYSAFLYFNVDIAIVKGNILTLNSTNYSSSIVRFNQVNTVISSGNTLINKSSNKSNNAFQIDTCGLVLVHNNIIKNFDTGIFLSNDSTSVNVHDNDCKTCTKVINRTDAAFLVLHHNTSAATNNPGWQTITLINNWTAQSSRTPRFRVNDDGEVTLSFAVGGGTLGTIIGYIPTQYAPKRNLTVIGYTSSSVVAVSIIIGADGSITIPTSNNGNASTSFIALEFTYNMN